MSDRIPRAAAAAKETGDVVKKLTTSETKIVRDTVNPEQSDPAWADLGRTRVVNVKRDDTGAGKEETITSASTKITERTPARVLGKDLVNIGDYQLKNKLGEGAMGAVFKAMQVNLDGKKLDEPRTVALKVLFPHVASNPKLVERLYREGRAMNQLDHPNIVHAYAIGEAEGFHFVAMEYVSGQNTQKWLTKIGKMPVADAVNIALICAKAIGYAHQHDMIHRDIKPENILLTKEGVVKIADLGMVKTHDEDMSLTQTGHAVGTPWYMPLEQARNAKEIDGRSDIYALGCTIYAFLTGKPPFVGRTIVDVIQAKEVGTFAPARQANVDVPERLDLILAKMIAKQPKHRYQTCEELVKDLESLDLAGATLSFLRDKPVARPNDDDDFSKLKATVETVFGKSTAEKTPAEGVPTLDPNVWYLHTRAADGTPSASKYTTVQLQKMLEDGVIKPNAKISHSQTEGFRAVATYKEFQGQALAKATKKGADKQSSRYRNIKKKIDDKDRELQQKEREDHKNESRTSANTRYWLDLAVKALPVGLGVGFFGCLLYWLASTEAMSPLVPILPGVAFVGSLVYAFFARR